MDQIFDHVPSLLIGLVLGGTLTAAVLTLLQLRLDEIRKLEMRCAEYEQRLLLAADKLWPKESDKRSK